ncbi:putative gamma-glutamylcyclotransferase At3g02910 [Aristolochia californica]|uniref:putative gamma-glutamylcyclotransferase At3g02910 n=1 Tax=Aristolochia californica TaxID=171875 RepID=UPI0035D920FA
MGAAGKNQTPIFTYGTLKRGFSNHPLIQDMIRTNDAVFLGIVRTVDCYPLVCGPYRVPFLLNLPGSGKSVSGELYAVSAAALHRMDELEGTSRSHYERLPLEVQTEDGQTLWAQAYYAHRSYAAELWKRNSEKGFCSYSEEEAKGYVKRKDRPQHLTFLEQIRTFVSSEVSD